jgi:branched-subunit amino acid aminotransferase/4-amino-4-deoxychorismate lyase
VKDLQWAKDRQALYDAMAPDTEELLLMDPATQSLLEGSQTNFFVVDKQGRVLTAEDGILKGTMRDLVLKSCAVLGIPVVFQAPCWRDVLDWSGAFLTSTSRLVMPIDRIVMMSNSASAASFRFAPCPVIAQLVSQVLLDIQRHSTQVFP